jgi:hypothetical protein
LVGVGSIHAHLNSGGVKSLLTAAPGNSQQDQQDEGYPHGTRQRSAFALGQRDAVVLQIFSVGVDIPLVSANAISASLTFDWPGYEARSGFAE